VCGEIYNPEDCKIPDKTYFNFMPYLTILAVLFATIMVIFVSKWWWNGGAYSGSSRTRAGTRT
jgi:hypothetical protein